MQVVMVWFKGWCGLLCVEGTIDGIHISITKHVGAYANNLYYLKQKDITLLFIKWSLILTRFW